MFIFEPCLKNGSTSNSFQWENGSEINGWIDSYLKCSILPSIFKYKPWLVGEGGFNIRVAYPVNLFSTQ